MPRKIPTLLAMAPIETWNAAASAPNHPGTTAEEEPTEQRIERIWNTEFSATSTAASSPLPQASMFQIRTIAMQRARPMMMSPVR